jgi:hypothetical protein
LIKNPFFEDDTSLGPTFRGPRLFCTRRITHTTCHIQRGNVTHSISACLPPRTNWFTECYVYCLPVELYLTNVDVFKNCISVGSIIIWGLDVLSTNHSLIPKEDGNLSNKTVLTFWSEGMDFSLDHHCIKFFSLTFLFSYKYNFSENISLDLILSKYY